MRLTLRLSFIISIAIISCTRDSGEAVLSGTISNALSDRIILSAERIHYKFSDPEYIEATVGENGFFEFRLDLEGEQHFKLIYNNNSFPVFMKPGQKTSLSFHHAHFPGSIRVSGFGRAHYESLLAFLDETESLTRHMARERSRFVRSQPNEYLNAHRNKISRAKEFLGETPFSFLIYGYIGEYLVGRLHEIKLRKEDQNFNVDLARLSVLTEAQLQRFFSHESLKAQRAGIRDFSNEWIQTFGIQSRILSESQPVLNWVIAAGDEVRMHRLQLLDSITDPDARLHALMYFIAEELGDFDFQAGSAMLEEFRSELEAKPEYLAFLEHLHYELSLSQPGMEAIPFQLETFDGDFISLEDFQGTYLLLEFWASWCPNCARETADLIKLRETYGETDLQIVSVSLDESEEAWRAALSRINKPWIHTFDGNGFDQETFRSYRAGSIPYYVLIGRDGTILRNNDIRPSLNLVDVLDDLIYADLDHTYAGQN
ncbi:Peroxiredoxin [Cyclonatronum proteinivorum]|uniref:Peroxiredoxin n=1 Tax=Cyclonatronum proteinivorum TaxID=1457365 RepID=A0A345UK66_9BACT|nr:TlpA disulfide reductase family protein [Cyclonatronum proteinivorum]AXJ00868.1 Peroxiredoxin [Cyclonatronum proteinivorum]